MIATENVSPNPTPKVEAATIAISRLSRYTAPIDVYKRQVESTLDEHRLFYDYLYKGDGDSAYRLMVSHLMMPLRMHIVES